MCCRSDCTLKVNRVHFPEERLLSSDRNPGGTGSQAAPASKHAMFLITHHSSSLARSEIRVPLSQAGDAAQDPRPSCSSWSSDSLACSTQAGPAVAALGEILLGRQHGTASLAPASPWVCGIAKQPQVKHSLSKPQISLLHSEDDPRRSAAMVRASTRLPTCFSLKHASGHSLVSPISLRDPRRKGAAGATGHQSRLGALSLFRK